MGSRRDTPAARRNARQGVPPVVGDAFAGLPAVEFSAVDESFDGPVGVFLFNSGDPWCRTRLGVWWPTLNLWVDRLVLHPDDTPLGAHCVFPLIPPPGMVWASVHGQTLDGFAHVLVTGPDSSVVMQASGRWASEHDLAHLVLATLAAAAGLSETPDLPALGELSDFTLDALSGLPWNTPGWTIPADELPAKVLRAFGR